MFARLLLIGMLLLSSGCSLAFVNGPPDFIPADQPAPPGSCTIERFLPVLDAVGAGGFLVTALTNSDGDAVRFAAILSGALGFSSYTGFRRVGDCRERMFMEPGGPLPDTVSTRFLLPDPIHPRFSPDRGPVPILPTR